MNSRCFLLLSLLFAFVFLVTAPTWAQNQDNQGTGQIIYGCTVITKPGQYVLAKNITARQSDLIKDVNQGMIPGCIVIVADFVSLDLHGYTITGPGSGLGSVGIYITPNPDGRVPIAADIRGGCITKFERGINVESGGASIGHMIERVRLAGNGLGLLVNGSTTRVKDVVAVSNDGWGIALWNGFGHSVENCQAHLNGASGIYMRNDIDPGSILPATLGSRIVGNTVSGNGEYGIYAQCPSLILQNMAYNNGLGEQDNILVTGSGCTMSDNNPAP